MKTIQKLFERLAGITPDGLDRLRLAEEEFRAGAPVDAAALEIPACWRRPAQGQALASRSRRASLRSTPQR
jgi:hypothetical protein